MVRRDPISSFNVIRNFLATILLKVFKCTAGNVVCLRVFCFKSLTVRRMPDKDYENKHPC